MPSIPRQPAPCNGYGATCLEGSHDRLDLAPFGDVDIPDEGRVRAAVVDGRLLALSRCGGRLGALKNSCPHQGGPLGEGSIEKGLLRCPWHGYDYDPLTGVPPGDFADAVPAFVVEERADGAWVELPDLYAVLCGAAGETVRTRAELAAGMARLLAAPGPYLLHIVQDCELV